MSAAWVVGVALLLVGGPAAASAGGEEEKSPSCAEEVALRVQGHYEGVRDLQAEFSQSTHNAVLGDVPGAEIPARGRVVFAKPGRMRWVYESPEPSLVVSDGETLWIYDPTLKEVQVLSVDAGFLSGTAIQFLLGEGQILESFDRQRGILRRGRGLPGSAAEADRQLRAAEAACREGQWCHPRDRGVRPLRQPDGRRVREDAAKPRSGSVPVPLRAVGGRSRSHASAAGVSGDPASPPAPRRRPAGCPALRVFRDASGTNPPRYRGAAKFGGQSNSRHRCGGPSTKVSKLRQLTGRIASRSGTPHAENRTKPLIPYGQARSAFPAIATRPARVVGGIRPRARISAPDRRKNARFGGDLPIRRRLTWQGRLIDSKSRKRLKKQGVRRSLQCSSKSPVGSVPRELGTADRGREAPCGTGGRLLWSSILNSDPPPPEARTAIASGEV